MSEATKGAALTAALIVDGVQAADPVISPDGRWVAWTTSYPGEHGPQVSEFWLAPVGAGAAAIRLTHGSASVRLPRWSPDSAWLFYVAGEELRRLRITDAGPTAESEIESETVLRWRGEISGLAPLAGGQLAAVVASDEPTDADERRRAERDDANVWSERAEREHWRWHRLRLLNLESGRLTIVAGLARRHVIDLARAPTAASWRC